MLEAPSVISVPQQDSAVVRLNVPKADIRAVMPAAIKEVRAALAGQGIVPAGPMFTHHLVLDDAMFDIEVGFPIDAPLVETGRVRVGCLPAATVVRATYCGGYEGLSAGWGELRQWIDANGHARAAHLWEVYARGPEAGSDVAEWRTELNQPLGR
jgi:effector-binding domain-containing protein